MIREAIGILPRVSYDRVQNNILYNFLERVQ